jgi:hypothetical protein
MIRYPATTSLKASAALLTAYICLAIATPADAQGGVEVIVLDGSKQTIALTNFERHTVNTVDAAGIKTTHEGVALRDVLMTADIAMGDALRGKALSRVVIATARDGYQVVFSIAELDPAFNGQAVLIADQRNGRPLLPDSGPLQIVASGDKRPARWVRQLLTLEVRQLD